jgi:hypothetical protein
MFKCDLLHCFTRKQRIAVFLFVTAYSLFHTMSIANLVNTAIFASSNCSNTSTWNVNACEAKCPNYTLANVTACEAAPFDDTPFLRFYFEALFTFFAIKIPMSIWKALAEKLANCRNGVHVSYIVTVTGTVGFSLGAALFFSLSSHSRNAFIGYGFVLLYDYEPFSTYLLFRGYHKKIMKSGHYGHWQGYFLGHICHCAKDRRVHMLQHAPRSISLQDSVVTV